MTLECRWAVCPVNRLICVARHTWWVHSLRRVLAAAALCLVAAVVVAGCGGTAKSVAPAEWSWSAPHTLATGYAFDPQLAVAESSASLAGWFSGMPAPRFKAGGRAGTRGVRRAAESADWTGSKVVVDRGTVAGGFGPPVVLSTHGSDSSSGLHLALSASGVAFAAWTDSHGGSWMIATAAPDGAFSTPRTLLPKSANLLELLASRNGPVAAVWTTSGPASSSSWVLHYALLRADGSLGSAVTVGPWRPAAEEESSFALNDHGAFAAVGISGEQEGSPPPRPAVSVCNAAGGCAPPRVLKLTPLPAISAEMRDAVSMSDDGTVTVLAGYDKTPNDHGYSAPLGLWDVVRRQGGRWSTAHELSPIGNAPLATAYGVDRAVTVFQDEPGGVTAGLGWALLRATGDHYAKPAAVTGSNSPYPPVLAVNDAGKSVIAWYSNPQREATSANSSLAAATGNEDGLSPTRIVTSRDVDAKTIQPGIDRAGDALVIWISETSHVNQTKVLVAVHRP
jgi:hypothetical protein